jgi:beta-phosphoglucomutase
VKTKAILFDLDGILVDAADWHYNALNSALEILGHNKIDYADHLERFDGLPTKVKLETLGIPKEQWAEIVAMKREALDSEIMFSCKPDPEKVELLWELSKKYLIACCSNAVRRSVFMMLSNAGLMPYFDYVVGNDDGVRPKPEPDSYLKAMVHFKVDGGECFIVEDSPFGIAAAEATGCPNVIRTDYHHVTVKLFKERNLL